MYVIETLVPILGQTFVVDGTIVDGVLGLCAAKYNIRCALVPHLVVTLTLICLFAASTNPASIFTFIVLLAVV